MKKLRTKILVLLVIPVLAACQLIAEPDKLAPYYGTPQPARVIVNHKSYDSEIGNTKWIKLAEDGTRYMEFGDAFAIITPTKPIVTKPDLSLNLQLPIPINPTILWYMLFKVSEKDLNSQDSTQGAFRWNPNPETQMYLEQTYPSLLTEQDLTFSLKPGVYVLQIHAGWGITSSQTELEADYGFLFEVQE